MKRIIQFEVEIDPEGVRNHWKQYPDLKKLDRGTHINAIIREMIAAIDFEDLVEPGTIGKEIIE